jgi:hypothetical protein
MSDNILIYEIPFAIPFRSISGRLLIFGVSKINHLPPDGTVRGTPPLKGGESNDIDNQPFSSSSS